MRYRFDNAHQVTRSLLAVVLVLALAIPACMTLACADVPMSGHGSMGGMNLADCLGSGLIHDGLLAGGAASIASLLMTVALAAFALTLALVSPLSRMGWVVAATAASPPTPLDPRGERLLI